ncbi:hypothetical protein [Xanthomonas phage XPP1]|uniref:Uncharacterized protein n=3 Tax=Tsukubavirus TaxID=2948935 RepID=Q2NPA6_9CAUD|nr:hypothetical protein KEM11_gp04 [Xanthomonas phage XPP1]YP_010052518.1 hypothetical protein KEM12_gp37 [Xanthomonas phage XPV1]YP_453643.1 hypothetical protein OP2_ORF26 [Xanthomonas phage OP2]AVO23773.1 hypothetical protein [Xanthomonas phage XPP2]AVO23851.1 hypothetical protein [Xanthomonas phage XPP3]AVO23868.1 hypothetical protein [Xanthomonas phage XPP4]AVO23977.1 hypothetical protein [Xanthomonas phage XPP6]AVO24044.1 hypothetical protein [Xanthomonas phage XPP8]AVO24086.1 hypothet
MTPEPRNIGVARFGIAIFVMLLYGLALAVLMRVETPATNKDVLMLLLGNLGPLLGAIGGHYFTPRAMRGGANNAG